MSSELKWENVSNYREALLGSNIDGARFTLTHHPTCYRRGPWRLLIVVLEGPNHHDWGCFDEADQPMRYFHGEDCALREAQAIANVLWKDRVERNKPILPNDENLSRFSVDDWEMKWRSGYPGFRHIRTGEWIYETEYYRRARAAGII